MKILLTETPFDKGANKEYAMMESSHYYRTSAIVYLSGAKAQIRKIAELIKEDTEDNMFGLSDELYKALMEIK